MQIKGQKLLTVGYVTEPHCCQGGAERERDLFQGIGSLVGKAGEFKICRVGQQAGDPEQN